MTTSSSAALGLLPVTCRALTHRIAVGQVEGRTPSLAGAVVRDGGQAWFGARSGTVDHLDLGSFVFTREPYGPDAPPAARPDPEGWRAF